MTGKYTLDDLFRVETEITVTRRGQQRKLYLRTLGVAAEDARRLYASRRARELYRRLTDPDSQERKELLEPLTQADDDELIALLIELKRNETWREAQREVLPSDAPEPADDTVTELVKAELANEQNGLELQAARTAYVERRLAEYREVYRQYARADLIAEALRLRIDLQVTAQFSDAYLDATLYYAVYRDPERTQPLFKSPEQVAEADAQLREQLIQAYTDLDVFTLDVEELKN